MNFKVLHTLIAGNAGSAEAVSDWCNTPSIPKLDITFVTTRKMMAELGPVDAVEVITKLKSAAVIAADSGDDMLAITVDMLNPNQGGIDVSLPSVRQHLDALVTAAVLTATEAQKIKDIANVLISPAQSVGLPTVEAPHINFARSQYDD